MTPSALDRTQVVDQLTSVFRQVFDNEKISLRDEMTAKDVKDWDSLNHINLIVAVEMKFNIKLKTAEIARLANVGQFIDVILQKLQR